MKTQDLYAAAAVALLAFLIGRQLFSRDRYGIKADSEQSQMLRAQDEGLLW